MLFDLLTILGFNFIVITILWLFSLKTKRADFIDIYWGPSFFFSFLIIVLIGDSFILTNLIALMLIGIWGFRLGLYLLRRNLNKLEDIRYVKIREARGNIGLFLTAYLIQIILIPIISLPLLSIVEINNNFSTFLWISMLIAILGIVIEAIADLQLANFKANKSNAGKVMNRGLWYYSRHPNYFGDSLFWWGISIYCFTISGTILIFISPIIMTYLLLKVSGVTMLENRLSKKKDGYNEYIQTTSSFLILPKKKSQ